MTSALWGGSVGIVYCDHHLVTKYQLLWSFWLVPKVVTISDAYCTPKADKGALISCVIMIVTRGDGVKRSLKILRTSYVKGPLRDTQGAKDSLKCHPVQWILFAVSFRQYKGSIRYAFMQMPKGLLTSEKYFRSTLSLVNMLLMYWALWAVWGIGGIHCTNGESKAGETVSPLFHRRFTCFFTNFVSKFEQEFHGWNGEMFSPVFHLFTGEEFSTLVFLLEIFVRIPYRGRS